MAQIQVLYRQTPSCDESISKHQGLNPSCTILQKGFQKDPGTRPFEAATIFDRDIQIPLRDGVKLRADVFRPVTDFKVPALVVWSPYGKSGAGFFNLDYVPGRAGIPVSKLSGMEKFEGLDPAEWVGRGYAIVNIDARGVFESEGDIRWFGKAEGRDGYDAIEFIAQLPWCSGKTSLVGNSWLAMSQWFIAAERPPHLSCIAPWEGASDFYRETLCRGGVPYKPFWAFVSGLLFGRNKQEDVLAMLEKYPYMNEYWADKRAEIHKIEVPAYILASFSTGLHTAGSFRGYEEIPHDKKWLRVHPTQEWHDIYQPENVDDLCLFLDRYTKGIENGWEKTPNVRISMLPFNKVDADSEELLFTYTFPRKSYMVGYSKAVLYMSCSSHDDLDVFIQLRKASTDGTILQNINIPLKDMGLESATEVVPINTNIYLGPTGILRASHRAIHPTFSKPSSNEIIYAHTEGTIRKVNCDEVVRLEISIWPTAMVFEAQEKLVLKIAGHPLVLAEFEPLRGAFVADNKGRHVVHFGGQYDSHVEIPLIDM
ncbi:hypothetical protein FE257_006679 [Aspergillus nanangensis]|uniref:Xaa-Pro dipeptidyl-peptidase C-terminal domain-containing protein n=1 Tax=Aspergillus nanangensis TaxID=2582783 RepID=A0AAD4CNW9_ASPNN|nr:hypothetical protein FE257_006679 [Aspergillus nanangensis]